MISYKGLGEHIKSLVVNQSDFKTKFTGFHQTVESLDSKGGILKRKNYRKCIVNKWHVIAFLFKNPILILERKHNLLKQQETTKDKKKCCFCCRKKDQATV